jgi:response regulator of citrate/malate metabolism
MLQQFQQEVQVYYNTLTSIPLGREEDREYQECLEHHKWVDSDRLEMRVRQIYSQDSSLLVEEIAELAGVSKTTAYKYLRYLPKVKRSRGRSRKW